MKYWKPESRPNPIRQPPRSVYEFFAEDDDDETNDNHHQNRVNLDNYGFTFARGTPIQDFYAGQKIFITGGTGFIGKILIEKLLRSCPNVSKIYMLIRTKRSKIMKDRIEELFKNPLYDQLKEISPKFRSKIVGISGDCSVPGLGLSSADRQLLQREVTIVFHSAATVRFDEKMPLALAINVGSTKDVIELCHRMPNLKAFIHVSTAYGNCQLPKIEETFYSHPHNYDELAKSLEGLTDTEIKERTPKIRGKWPNTYSFTKALAEVAVRERCKNLSMGIFRPAVVTSCANEPKPGWIDNYYGPTGAIAAMACGVLRSVKFNPASRANVVPVDFTVNALLASAWDVANQPKRRGDNMLIYNYCSSEDYPITWEDYFSTMMTNAKQIPFKDARWAVGITFHRTRIAAIIGTLLLHYLPAVIGDFCRICTGKSPVLLRSYRKISVAMNALRFFYTNDWEFTNDNVMAMWQRLDPKDRTTFPFNVRELNWDAYFVDYIKGLRIYLLKDDMRSLEASKKLARRYNWINAVLKAIGVVILFAIMWIVLCELIV